MGDRKGKERMSGYEYGESSRARRARTKGTYGGEHGDRSEGASGILRIGEQENSGPSAAPVASHRQGRQEPPPPKVCPACNKSQFSEGPFSKDTICVTCAVEKILGGVSLDRHQPLLPPQHQQPQGPPGPQEEPAVQLRRHPGLHLPRRAHPEAVQYLPLGPDRGWCPLCRLYRAPTRLHPSADDCQCSACLLKRRLVCLECSISRAFRGW
ncbi:hypothetical protein BS78_01G195300 [Paspalum vaginatum]|nr:hypothetical protein BS78_01G195300 [Paspalum vaginatum]